MNITSPGSLTTPDSFNVYLSAVVNFVLPALGMYKNAPNPRPMPPRTHALY